ncbi:MAG: hypothetical protein ACFFDI_33570 [Promethearchaeota archaeon]
MHCPECHSDKIKRKVRKIDINQSFYCKDCHDSITISRFLEIFKCKNCNFKWENTDLQ